MLWATFRGPVSVEDSKQIVDIARATATGEPLYLVADLGVSSLSVAPRKYLAEHINPEWFRAIVFVGGGMAQKAVTKALMVALLFTGRTRFDTEFLHSLDDARAWIDAHRARTAQSAKGR
ncbi:hypothetical protein DRW03_16985 [Corallococcus sp. H22C18031201]|uniref:STAS/SEC14 domain-containing protein n=1 Tax=Citreicoccus inhibens TaxID=2849499 RepID=UPI000E715CB1|nr:STAS/SEC14 domain-containing protein [Citreicoccus inhibens]MBJ6760872.1 STAS/SEC14 domain-containing protein [Myxococcaceae bacterium JPH2]MBU8897329.1 STAS/SEC14 domain-containing protein [Citreicoccus inhibens]RJS21113.1 hypothetical protein DRW03_16985 [Corallococcus sp. H22C18031201]